MTQEDFKNLFDTHFDSVRNYIYYRSGDTELATDIAQETFMTIWEKQISPEDGKVIGLLFKISGNIFISNYRKNKVAMNYLKTMEFEREESTLNEIEYRELALKYERILANMPENQRIVFLMHRIDELKYREIAERLKLSVKAVEKRMKLALDYLKKELNR